MTLFTFLGCAQAPLVDPKTARLPSEQEKQALRAMYLVFVPPTEEPFGQESLRSETIAPIFENALRSMGGELVAYRVASEGLSEGSQDSYAHDVGATSVVLIRWTARQLGGKVQSPRFISDSPWGLHSSATTEPADVLSFTWEATWMSDGTDQPVQRISGRFRQHIQTATSAETAANLGNALQRASVSVAQNLIRQWMPFRQRPAPERSLDAPSIFTKRWLVLPFSDVSTSIDGPLFVRQLAIAALQDAGYHVSSAKETDDCLRTQGYTQGGQLMHMKLQEVAKACSADFVVRGDLDHFDDMNIAVLQLRQISGRVQVWDAARERFIEERSAACVEADAAKSFKSDDIASHFFTGLAQSWIEKAKHKPLAKESAHFVAEAFAALPRKPKITP